MNSHKAMIFVSQMGQLRHANNAFAMMDDVSPHVVILYTARNLQVPKKTFAVAAELGFQEIDFLKIHDRPNIADKRIVRFHENLYGEFLDMHKPAAIYLCSFERHYAVLCMEAQKRGIPVNLFEEGLATYKVLLEDYKTFAVEPTSQQIKSSMRRVWNNHYLYRWFVYARGVINKLRKPARSILNFIKQTASIPVLVARSIREMFFLPNLTPREKFGAEFFSGWRKFDKVFSSHPNLAGRAFDANEVVEVIEDFSNIDYIQSAQYIGYEYNFDSSTALYVSQPYSINNKAYTDAVIDCLAQIARTEKVRIYVKLHPRENAAARRKFFEGAINRHPDVSIHILDTVPLPAEYLVMYTQIQFLIGIISGTLLYCRQASDDLRIVSIGDAILNKLADKYSKQSGYMLLSQHMRLSYLIEDLERLNYTTKNISEINL